nr:metallophosphoesterase family protein [Aneurinibacillus sp. XH2]
MRKLFITDIHGEYNGMMKLLEYAKFDPSSDQLVVGGDMVSRGKDSGPVLKEVRKLALRYPEHVVALTGNHEEMMNWYYRGKTDMWLAHAGKDTFPSFRKTFTKEGELQEHVEWSASLPLLFEDHQFVYTHAGIVPYTPLEEQDREILWMSESDFYSYPKESILSRTEGRPVIHGHTPCEFIYSDGARMNCDLGASTYAVIEERALGLVDLTNSCYYVYKVWTGRIVQRKISVFA